MRYVFFILKALLKVGGRLRLSEKSVGTYLLCRFWLIKNLIKNFTRPDQHLHLEPDDDHVGSWAIAMPEENT